jgi:hypothetical protein
LTDETYDEVAQRIEAILGLSLTLTPARGFESRRDQDSYFGRALGLHIHLDRWGTLERLDTAPTPVFRLVGCTASAHGLNDAQTSLNDYIRAILEKRGMTVLDRQEFRDLRRVTPEDRDRVLKAIRMRE